MSRVTFRLSAKTVTVIIQIIRKAIVDLTANVATYATPNPPLATLTTQVDDLETKYEDAKDGGKAKKRLVKIAKKTLLSSVSSLVGYIQTTSEGDEATILLVAGVFNNNAPVGLLPPPGNVRSDYGDHNGELIFRWAAVTKRSNYQMQINKSPMDDTKWEDLQPAFLTGKNRQVVGGLISGSNYGFRVATVNAYGTSAYSDATYHKAP